MTINAKHNPLFDPFIAPPCNEEIEVLFQDEHMLLINKPTKLLSLSGKNPANLDSVHYRLRQHFPSALMIHRLDLGTSGIMMIALSKNISTKLNRQFSERQVNKTYTALLAGHIQQKQGLIELPIAKGEFPHQKICYNTGKSALTEYTALAYEVHTDESNNQHPVTRVLYKPHTGRTHQLRIHSQQIGHPIIGCDLYPSLDGSTIQMAKRLMLHATSIEFNHPSSGERILARCDCHF
jgi:tRNA pseudouridine32 synthase/23S rRNA pseudouridine746 synthase